MTGANVNLRGLDVTPQASRRGGWVCCHLGAREHYAVARSLHRKTRLRALATDAWAAPDGVWTRLPGATGQRLRERFSAELAGADIHALTGSLLAHEVLWKVQGRTAWSLPIARNTWFQQRAARFIHGLHVDAGDSIAVFAHSYAALAAFREAKARGFTTVLGQIDPGEAHFTLVTELATSWPEYGPPPPSPPAEYFDAWREECRLADWIVVNSDWSRELLERAGIARAKLKVIPLAYEPESGEPAVERAYPAAFTPERPLEVLFVGSVTVAKGIASLLEAVDRLAKGPVSIRLSIVGDVVAAIPARYRNHHAIRWLGPVPRRDVMEHYRQSDVLVFPSHSDGFGMAQVEAQGWRLPIIASRSCGRVVEHGVNGLLLDQVSAESIAAALLTVGGDAGMLSRFAQASAARRGQSVDALGDALLQLEAA